MGGKVGEATGSAHGCMLASRTFALLLLASAPQRVAAQPPDPSLFDYGEHASPVALFEDRRTARDGVTVRVVRFPSPVTGEVPALLYEPDRSTPGPGLVLVHGIPGDRTSWDALARAYAAAGVTVVAPSGPSARFELEYREPRLFPSPLYSRWDSAEVVHAAIDVRRAVDLLHHHPAVDPDRIGVVGHSYGAYVGGLLAAVEPRLAAVALMAPTNGWATWQRTRDPAHFMQRAFGALSEADRRAWFASVEPLEWSRWIAGAPGHRLLVQVGTRDVVVAETDTEHLVASLPVGARVQRFDAEHALNAAAYAAQAAFLAERLRFDPAAFTAPPPPGD